MFTSRYRHRLGLAVGLWSVLLAGAGLGAETHGEPAPGAETHTLQIEDFDGPWRSQTNIPGYLGTGFKTSNADGVAQTVMRGTVTITHAGRYAVWARGYEGRGGDRSFFVEVNGQALPPTHTRKDRNEFSWQWAGNVELEPGEVGVTIHDHGDSFEVTDAVLLTTDPAFDPGLYDRRSRVLNDGAAENLRLVDVIIERTVASAEAAHAQWEPAMATPETWEPARKELQRRFRAAVGLDPWPERTPLNAQILGETQKDGYVVQRLIFESRPGFVVTANVYVPPPPQPPLTKGGKGGYPAVLCPPGHWPHAKAQPQVQARCIGLAKRGFLALTYDPFGQGERAVEGNGHQEYFRAVLAGRNNMSYMLWDTVRALDYLLTREDVDPDRIACTGASGGGLNTLYVGAIDERIDVAVPVVYATAFREFLGTRADHCPCSHIPGLARCADMGDIAALLSPRPMLLMTAQQDPQFTVAGAHHAAAEARPAYRAYGREANLEVREFASGHDYNQEMREALYGFLRKHLQGEGDGSPVPEPQMTLEDPASPVLRCFENGRVPATTATVRALARQEAAALNAALPAPPAASREALAELLHWPTGPVSPATPEPVPQIDDPQGPEKVLLRTADGIALPGLFYRAGEGAGRGGKGQEGAGNEDRGTVVVFGTEGIRDLRHSPRVAALREAGSDVFLVDLRGWGETSGREHLLATNSLLLGQPLVTQRVVDALAVAAYLRTRGDVSDRIALLGLGVSGGLVALTAKALDLPFSPGRESMESGKWKMENGKWTFSQQFASNLQSPISNLQVTAPDLPSSLLDLYDAGVPPDAAVWELLQVADIPHLKALGTPPVRANQEFGPLWRTAGSGSFYP